MNPKISPNTFRYKLCNNNTWDSSIFLPPANNNNATKTCFGRFGLAHS